MLESLVSTVHFWEADGLAIPSPPPPPGQGTRIWWLLVMDFHVCSMKIFIQILWRTLTALECRQLSVWHELQSSYPAHSVCSLLHSSKAGGYWNFKRTGWSGWARSHPVPSGAALVLRDIVAMWAWQYFKSPGLRLARVTEWRIVPQRSQRCWGQNCILHPEAFQDSDLRLYGWKAALGHSLWCISMRVWLCGMSTGSPLMFVWQPPGHWTLVMFLPE